MIVFNVIYNLMLRHSEPRLKKRCQKIEAKIKLQFERIQSGSSVDDRHLNYLRHTLRHVNNLMAFDRVVKPLVEGEHNEIGKQYLSQIQPVILYLATLYQKRENVQAAYYSYLLSQYTVQKAMQNDTLQDILLDYVRKENLYCRVNGLQALYAFGNAEHILEALQILDDGKVFMHEKILTEGLLSFSGDHKELIDLLWAKLDLFSEHTQLAILNYIRLKSGAYKEDMFAILQDPSRGKELQLAAIRYFGKYEYEPALNPLLRLAADENPLRWEYTTVSVSSLSLYPGEQVIDVLKRALHHPNWYVRYAASVSLEAHHVDSTSLIDIVAGHDRYAREMMMYRLETRKLQKEKVLVKL